MPIPRPHEDEPDADFMRRCMGDDVMRREFPSQGQRVAVCRAQLRRRGSVEKALDLCCGLAKADRGDAEVDAVARFLRPLLSAHWRRLVARAVEEARQRLLALEDDLATGDVDAVARAGDRRDKALQDLVVAILASLRAVMDQPPSAGTTSAVREAAGRLLRRGAEAAGAPFLGTHRGTDLRAAVADDLLLSLRLRAESGLQAAEPLVRAALTRRDLRRAAEGIEALVGRPGQPVDLRTWIQALERALGAEVAAWLDPAVDLWAYRWANVASFLSARADGFIAFRALNNPPTGPDLKTTPFCRWVHGRLIPIGQAERSVDGYLSALRSGERVRVERAWPLLSSAVAQRGTVRQFEAGFATVGLPPYHFRCRTVARPVTLA